MKTRTAAAVAMLVALALVALPALVPGPARANGVPQLVKLTYLEGVSNFGPKDAEGVLEFSFAEGYAHAEVKNLVPAEGTVFDGWMVAPDGAAILVGQFQLGAAGVGALDAKFTGLTRYDYNLFVVTPRPAGTPSASIPGEKSIAGRFTVLRDGQGAAAPGDTRPQVLPDTGERPPLSTAARLARTAGVMLLAGAGAGALVAVRRRRKRD